LADFVAAGSLCSWIGVCRSFFASPILEQFVPARFGVARARWPKSPSYDFPAQRVSSSVLPSIAADSLWFPRMHSGPRADSDFSRFSVCYHRQLFCPSGVLLAGLCCSCCRARSHAFRCVLDWLRRSWSRSESQSPQPDFDTART
jgi:hypothetical protein